jgi:hypothetical protein
MQQLQKGQTIITRVITHISNILERTGAIASAAIKGKAVYI